MISDFIDACGKLNGGADSKLREYLEVTSTLSQLSQFNTNQALAIGMKGIGKSAAYSYLTEFGGDADVIIGINPAHYTLNLPAREQHFSVYQKLFEEDLIFEALRAIGDKREVSAALRADARSAVKPYMDRIKAVVGQLAGISALGFSISRLPAQAHEVVGLVGHAEVSRARMTLSRICSNGVRVRIVVDDPEQVFSSGPMLNAHLVGGFCLASLSISSSLPNVKMLVLLKKHIYRALISEISDLDQYPLHAGILSWSEDELVEMVSRRLTWANAKWTEVFDGPNAWGRETVKHMAEKVRNGPRDLLHWLYLAMRKSEGRLLTQDDIDRAMTGAATVSLQVLESAFSSQYEGVASVVNAIFSPYPNLDLSPSDLERHIGEILDADPKTDMLRRRFPWLQAETPRSLLEIFLHIGVLKLTVNDRYILPYNAQYDASHLEGADTVSLVPLIASAIAGK
jgi:hypothetical protein